MFKIFKILIIAVIFPLLLGAVIPEPPKSDKIPSDVQEYLQTIYDELSRDNTETGLKLPSGALFYMISGSCPTGSTDVTSTYSNKFVKVNATQGTSSGTVLTGTSDSHTLTSAEMPSHTHNVLYEGGGPGATNVVRNVQALSGTYIASEAAGSGGGHTHTLSAATTLEPSSITAKMCQVN